ncbi:hypothetical protein D3C77_619920 [compost metagenome]
MIVGELPGFTGVVIVLGAQVAVEMLVRCYRRVHQQGLEAVALGQIGGIVAAERTTDQQWRAELGDGRFELGDGLARVMVQGGHTQLGRQAQLLHHGLELARLG